MGPAGIGKRGVAGKRGVQGKRGPQGQVVTSDGNIINGPKGDPVSVLYSTGRRLGHTTLMIVITRVTMF